MAKAINFPESNKILGKPADWTDEQCYGLPVQTGKILLDDQGNVCPYITSKWEFTEEEIKEIVATKSIYLIVCGNSMPPVSIGVENPTIR